MDSPLGATTELLFSYGTLRSRPVQLATYGRELEGVASELCGYRRETLHINSEQVAALSGANEHPVLRRTGEPSDRVGGTVFELTPGELARTDEYETDQYRRIRARTVDGMQVWVYIEA